MLRKHCSLNKLIAFGVLICVFCLVSGCSSKAATNNTEEIYYSFIDSQGNDVVLYEQPKIVAVCFSSLADMYVNAGGEISVSVGESIERGFVGEDVLLVDSGAGKKIDTELLISYEPDLVIYSADIAAQLESYEIICEAGIPAACFEIDSFEDYLYVFGIMCNITGNAEAYKTYGTDLASRIDALIDNFDKELYSEVDILFIRCGSGSSSTKAKNSDDNFVCGMLRELGVHNIADDATVLIDGLNLEIIIQEDPDYIFFSTMGDREAAVAYMESVLAEPGWSSLTAVKEHNYDFLPKDMFQYKPNANWDKAYEYLIGLLNNATKQ